MDMLDQTLDSNSQDKTNESTTSDDTAQMQADDGSVEEVVDDHENAIAGATGLLESGVQYPFRTDNGQVTFRVVQVTQGAGDATEAAAQVITTSAFTGQQGVPTVIASPFSNGSSPTTDGQAGEARFTYFPAVAAATTDGSQDGAATAALAATPAGQFYVMMSPQDVLTGGQRTIAPRTHQYSPKVDGTRTVRDERRRATHNEAVKRIQPIAYCFRKGQLHAVFAANALKNENADWLDPLTAEFLKRHDYSVNFHCAFLVERRRRDKINNWIIKLSKIVPDCTQDHTKQGQSKGGILAKTCDYIHDLRTSNQRLMDNLKESERLSVDTELLRQQCEELKNENALLRAQLQQHGIVINDLNASNS